jgi:hypothetical protein
MSTVTKGFFIKNILKNDKVEMPSAAKKLTWGGGNGTVYCA